MVKDFKAWDLSQTNKAAQATYDASLDLADGVAVLETADSSIFNKAMGQATFWGAVIASLISDVTGLDTADDGDLAAAQAKLITALLMQAGLENTVSTNQAPAVADNRTFYVNTVAVSYALPLSTSPGMSKSWRVAIYALGGDATLTINGADKINGGTLGVGMTLPQGSFANITTDGANNYYVAVGRGAGGVTTITANTTLTPGQEGIILMDSSAGNVAATLPLGANRKGLRFTFFKVSTDANTCTVAPNAADSFPDNPGANIAFAAQYEGLDVLTDGAPSGGAKWFQRDQARRITNALRLATGRSDLYLESGTAGYWGANVTFSPGAVANRKDTAQAAAAIKISRSGTIQFLTAPAGANPIVWTTDNIITAAGGTMTGLLALFAASTVPTAAKGDTTTKIASTGFVKAEGIQTAAGVAQSSGALATSNLGKSINATVTGALTLPLLSAVRDGDGYLIINTSASATAVTTLNVAGADTINDGVTNIAIPSGTWALVTKGNGKWLAGGSFNSGRLQDFGAFYSTNGYQKLPGGLMVQWFNASLTTGDTVYNLPFTFPNTGLAIFGSGNGNSPDTGTVRVSFGSPSNIKYNAAKTTAGGAFILAIGN